MRGWCASARAAAMRSASGARPRVSLSGLPGVTSHHTRSRLSRFIASRQAARCAACGGSKVPPNRPMRMPGAFGGRTTRSRIPALAAARREGACSLVMTFGRIPSPRIHCRLSSHHCAIKEPIGHGRVCPLPRTRYLKLVSCSTPTGPRACSLPVAMPISAPKPNSPPSANCVEALCSTIAEFDLAQEFFRRGLVLGDDRVGVMRAVALDMGDRRIDAVDHAGGDDGVEIFGAPIGLARRLDAAVGGLHRGIAAHLAAGVDQHRRRAA